MVSVSTGQRNEKKVLIISAGDLDNPLICEHHLIKKNRI